MNALIYSTIRETGFVLFLRCFSCLCAVFCLLLRLVFEHLFRTSGYRVVIRVMVEETF